MFWLSLGVALGVTFDWAVPAAEPIASRGLQQIAPAIVVDGSEECSHPVEITYSLPRAGRVSLAVYDAAGNQLRNLAAGEERTAGPHVAIWDGLDHNGRPAPPGPYTWKLLANQGLEADFITVLGVNPNASALDANPGPRPWDWWLGNHTGPTAVAAGGDAFYVGAAIAEGTLTAAKLSADARTRRWSIDSHQGSPLTNEGAGWFWFGPRAMAVVGSELICLAVHGTMVCKRRVSDGMLVPAAFDHPTPGGGKTSYLNLLYSRDALFVGGRGAANRTDMDADEAAIIVSFGDLGKVAWYDTTTGALLKERAVANPGQVARGEGGTAYVITGDKVVRLSDTSDDVIELPLDETVNPTALAYDRLNHELLVANGSPDWRILRFRVEGATGAVALRPVAAYGSHGGRGNGPFVRDAFKHVIDLACDETGGFYVVEDGLRRVSHVNAGGHVDLERFGGALYFSAASAAVDRPNEVWMVMSENTVVCYDIAYAADEHTQDTAAWRIKSVYEIPDGFPWPLVSQSATWKVRRWNERTYFVNERTSQVMRLDEVSHQILPAAYADRMSTWSDRNGNGRIEPDEIRAALVGAPMPFTGTGPRLHFDADFTIVLGTTGLDPSVFAGQPFLRFPNIAAPGALAPEWDLDHPVRPGFAWAPELFLGTSAVGASPDGRVFLYLTAQADRSADKHPDIWPGTSRSQIRIAGFAPEGVQWMTGKHFSHGPAPGAQSRFPSAVPGFVKRCVILGDRAYYGATAWTEDGLYAGFFLDRHVSDRHETDRVPDRNYLPDNWGDAAVSFPRGDDWDAGSQVMETPDGRVLWFAPGGNCVALYRIRGWEDWHRDSGIIELDGTAPAASREGAGLRAEYFANTVLTAPPAVTRINGRIWFFNRVGSIGLDEGDWSNGPGDRANGPVPGIGADDPFSVRWTGRLVAPLSEPFWFRVYNAYAYAPNPEYQFSSRGSGFVRFWLNGKLLIDQWTDSPPRNPWEVGPIALKAGESYDVKLEYMHPVGASAGAQISLVWSSYTLDWTRISQKYLYPDVISPSLPIVAAWAEDRDAHEAGEDPARVRFQVNRRLGEDLVIRYRIVGSAGSEDYWPVSGQIVIPAGATESFLALKPVEDSVWEGDESLVVSMSVDDRYQIDGSAGEAALVIHDSDNRVTEGLAAYYPMDEFDGLIMHDAASEIFHGSLRNIFAPVPTPEWRPFDGYHGGALKFAESAEAVDFPRLPTLTGFSVAFWLKTSDAHGPLLTLLPRSRVPGPCDAELRLYLLDGRLKADFCGISTDCDSVADDRWHHVVYRYEPTGGGLHSIHLDGRMCAVAGGLPGNRLGDTLRIGGYEFVPTRPTHETLGAQLDELRIYNRRLHEDEISVLANPVIAPGGSGFTAWIHASGLSGPDTSRNADPDADGVANLAEYAFGGNPAAPDRERLSPEARVASLAGQRVLCVTYPRAVAAALIYRVEWSLNLTHWANASEVPGFFQEVLGEVGGVPWIRACIPNDSRSSAFVRIIVEEEASR